VTDSAGREPNDAQYYYKREQPLELQRVHIESTQKKILHRDPEEASETNTEYIGREGT
jgi:hypothetical protein